MRVQEGDFLLFASYGILVDKQSSFDIGSEKPLGFPGQ